MKNRVIFLIYNRPGRFKEQKHAGAINPANLEMLNRQPSGAEVLESVSVDNMILSNKASTIRFKHFLYYIIFKFIYAIPDIL